MTTDPFICKICGGSDAQVVYAGPIRFGKFGNLSSESYQLHQCLFCQVITLPNLIGDINAYYESEAYRQDVDAAAEVAHYYRLHDQEQLRHLSITGTEIFRDKIVADIGCGAGSFLDAVRGYAKIGIAIEPTATFRSALAHKGYMTYAYTKDALQDYEGQVDIAVNFSVLEHIENPLPFLQEIRRLLKPQGQLILSTPNANDILLQVLPEDYPQFFYRKVHLWYFSPTALRNLLEIAGYTQIKIIPYQRFGLGNFLAWLRDKKPQGDISMNFITPAIDQTWKAELERTECSDYLFVKATASEN